MKFETIHAAAFSIALLVAGGASAQAGPSDAPALAGESTISHSSGGVDGSFGYGASWKGDGAAASGTATGAFDYSPRTRSGDLTLGIGGTTADVGVSASGVNLDAVSGTPKGASASWAGGGSVANGATGTSASGVQSGSTSVRSPSVSGR